MSLERRKRAVALLVQIPWSDMDLAIRVLEGVLGRALEATTQDFWRCKDHVGPELKARGFDECSISPAGRYGVRLSLG
jgi:hypothetical protein